MNVQAILEAVGRELQHDPDVATAHRDRVEVLDRAHRDLCGMRAWPWLYRQAPLWVYPDLSIASTGLTALTDVGTSVRQFAASRAALMAAGLGNNAQLVRRRTEVLSSLLDAQLGLATKTEGTGWDEGPYEIDQVLDSETRTGSPSDVVFLSLSLRAVVALAGTEGPAVISWARRRLPADVGQIERIALEDGRELTYVHPRDFERLRRPSVTQAGTPAYWTLDEGQAPEHPQPDNYADALMASNTTALSPSTVYGLRNEPVHEEITATIASGGSSAPGAFEVGPEYRVFCCWLYQGRYGPPSNVVSVTFTSAGSRLLVIGNLPVLPDGYAAVPIPDTGRSLAFFVSRDAGPFYLWDIAESGDIPYATKGTRTFALSYPGPLVYQQGRIPRWDEVYPGGAYKYVRLHPKPASATRLLVRYYSRPPQLRARSDEPWFDEGFHDYLVSETVCRLLGRSSSDVLYRRHRMAADAAFSRMCAFYLPGGQVTPQKGRIDQRRSRRVPLPTVNWQGD